MPGMYQRGEYDLAGTIVGVVDRTKMLDGARIRRGDVILGLASNGLHTNGYSLARKVLFEHDGPEAHLASCLASPSRSARNCSACTKTTSPPSPRCPMGS